MPREDLRVKSIESLGNAWVQKVLAVPGVSDKMLTIGVKKALDCSRLLSVTKHHQDLKFVISCWSVESHTFTSC